MSIRDHQPIPIDTFNGLWKRGSAENTPLDHFQDCINLKHSAGNDIATRDGVGICQSVNIPLSNIRRAYNYPTQTGNTLIVLTFNYGTNTGSIYHVVNPTTVFGSLLDIVGMTDFAFVPYAGRGYISPFTTTVVGGLNVESGLQSQFLYVYAGDGTAARTAAGSPLTGTLTIANGAAGNTDPGFHIFAFVSETSTGFLAAPGANQGFTTSASSSVSFGTVPTGSSNVVKRHLVATKVITGFNGDLNGYQFFFVPNAVINDNTTLFLNNISFFDADLLQDASYLIDNYSSIPAGAVLSIYHNRLCLSTTFTDISLVLVSAPGEPEAISQIDGLLVFPLDGNPITNHAELRDVFYVMKRARTIAFTDNGDVPSSWPLAYIDNSLGTCVHGISTVLDSGSTTVDYLLIATYQGFSLFNGKYITPELSWKIEDFWRSLDRTNFRKIQILNNAGQKQIYIILPNQQLLVGNYSIGMDSKSIRWEPWSFAMAINTIAIWNIDQVIIGADIA